jgi:acetyl-CoA acetyltransferase
MGVNVAGVGMIPFTKPGASDDYPVMGEAAARLAIEDAGIDYSKVGQVYVGYVYGDSTAGQAAVPRALLHCSWRAKPCNQGL